MADEAAITRRRAGEPVREMAAIAGAAGGLPRAVDERELLDGLVGGIVDVVGRTGERIAGDVERELLAVPRGAAVVGHQDDETRLRQEMVVPAIGYRVAPHVGVAAMNQNEERVLLALVKVRGEGDEVVDAAAIATGEPEFAQRLPVNDRGCRGRKRREESAFAGGRIDTNDLRRPDGAFPIGKGAGGCAARRAFARWCRRPAVASTTSLVAPPATGTANRCVRDQHLRR